MKRVAIITNIPAPYRVDFFDYLQKNYKEYDFTIIYSSKNEDNRKWKIDQEKLAHSIFLKSRTIKVRKRYDTKYIHLTANISKVLKKLQPDVVIGSEYNPTVIQAVRYCRKKRLPFISWTDGTLHSERNINALQKYLRTYVISHADAYIASSAKSREAQLFYGAAREKCHISLLTVDLEKYRQEPKGEGTGKILYVGSLIERKGVDLLIRALTEVTRDFELYLVGDGDEKEHLIELMEGLKPNSRVHFLGHLDRRQLLKYYAQSDLFVLPTREDCFALVILEAMCAKLPVICSKYADGAYDLIREGKNGFIVDPYDQKAFAERLDQLLGDSELRRKLGSGSEEVLDTFKFENTAKGYVAAIEDCLKHETRVRSDDLL